MIVKKCFACGSSSVNVLKSSNGWKTIHQFCAKCGEDQTKHVLAMKKARITRKTALRRTKTKKTRKSLSYAFGLIGWVLFSLSALVTTVYAQMSEPIVYKAEVATSTPVEIVKPVETEKKPETIVQKIDRVADENNIPRWKLHQIISCESSYNPNARNVNKKEFSVGAVQINTLVHKVTIKEAENIDFSLAFLIKHWGKRHQMWVVCANGT